MSGNKLLGQRHAIAVDFLRVVVYAASGSSNNALCHPLPPGIESVEELRRVMHVGGDERVQRREFDAWLETWAASDLKIGPVSSALIARFPPHLRPDMHISLSTGGGSRGADGKRSILVADEHEAAFQVRKMENGSRMLFHGSRLQNWYGILRRGLEVKTFDRKQEKNGAIFGAGMYFSDDLKLCATQFAPFGGGYKGSTRFERGASVVGLFEVVTCPEALRGPGTGRNALPAHYFVCTDSRDVVLRALLVWKRRGGSVRHNRIALAVALVIVVCAMLLHVFLSMPRGRHFLRRMGLLS